MIASQLGTRRLGYLKSWDIRVGPAASPLSETRGDDRVGVGRGQVLDTGDRDPPHDSSHSEGHKLPEPPLSPGLTNQKAPKSCGLKTHRPPLRTQWTDPVLQNPGMIRWSRRSNRSASRHLPQYLREKLPVMLQ